MKNKERIFRLSLAAIFLALAYILPIFTGHIPEIGSMFCPMHLPVLLCGFICGWRLGLTVGFIASVTRSLIFGMPRMFPSAICMAVELAAYGAVSGFIYRSLPKRKAYIYCALLVAMIAGRIVWGISMLFSIGIKGGNFTFAAFIAGAVTKAIPGIVLQVIFIPPIVMLIEKTGVLHIEERH